MKNQMKRRVAEEESDGKYKEKSQIKGEENVEMRAVLIGVEF